MQVSKSTSEVDLRSEAGVAEATHGAISIRRLQQLRQRGGGPPFVKIGRQVLYDLNDVRDWLDERKRLSTSDSGGQR